MKHELTADDLAPLAMSLTPTERNRLLQMIIAQCLSDEAQSRPKPIPEEDMPIWNIEESSVVKVFHRETPK